MRDVYQQLAIMSKGLQSNSLIISDVSKYVSKTVRALMKLKDNPGDKEAWLNAECAKDEGANVLDTCALQVYDGVDEDMSCDRTQVLTALKLHLESRFTKVLDHPILQAPLKLVRCASFVTPSRPGTQQAPDQSLNCHGNTVLHNCVGICGL